MKNAKIVKVCQIVVQVCNIATIIAKTLMEAFPEKKSISQKLPQEISQEDAKLIKEFLASENIKELADDCDK